ncbi:GntR family transcriptional regulator [Arthrobacter pityocampae]|uniref:GntR family transcriptional regulator n=1 Tax=Arthrobacter pityocampae TaxID=547334 RepID=A0A2S5ITY8_9MICC|nr:GntR family transcriptional regulator [Arthrobacter pityocampae]PPB48024.1 GntR family transcriptional regulator [Arthrobacter pityocampae]
MTDMETPEAPEHLLDPGSSEPLHLQLRGHLRAQILNHSLPPGTSLPSEAQLQVRYGVSRSVVRQALGALTDEGLIERGRGRGSTVAPRREHHRLVHRTSGLSAQLGSTGATVGTEVLSLTVQDADASTAVLGTPQVLALERLRTADGVPIAVIHTWLPAPTFADMTAESLHDASLHAVLGEQFGVQITSGKRQIRAVPGDQELLRLLKLEASSPVLLLEGTSFDQDGRPVEVFSTWHHPDHVVFDIDIQREPSTLPAPPPPPIRTDGPETIADRARSLGAELIRFADEVTDEGH